MSVSHFIAGLVLLVCGNLTAADEIKPFSDVTESVGLKGLGGGVAAWVDFDNDGFTDLYVSGQLWRNENGERFQAVENPPVGSGTWGDFNNDGFVDFFSWDGKGSLYRNVDGKSFQRTKDVLPELPTKVSLGAAWADLNGDGYLDLYVGGYEVWPSKEFPDVIYLNEGGRSFKEHWCQKTIRRARGITACDFDEDGDTDIYVSNYRLQPNALLQNDGSAVFKDVATPSGTAGDGDLGAWGHTIGSAWGDFDNDGHFDLFVGNFSHPPAYQDRAKFLRNTGPNSAEPEKSFHFEDKTSTAGLHWQESYASPALADFDNDGNLDLLFTTVYGGDNSVLYRNTGDWKFVDVTKQTNVSRPKTYQAAWADFNNDGWLDLVTGGRLFQNPGGSNRWVRLQLATGKAANIIGTQVRIQRGSTTLTRQVESSTGQGNQNESTVHFGLGTSDAPVDVEIVWPNGKKQKQQFETNKVHVVTMKSQKDATVGAGKMLKLKLRYQSVAPDSGEWKPRTRDEEWDAAETAIVVCDVWDQHHCLNAVRRLEQFAPVLDRVLGKARKQGVTIIHSPSDCMPAYEKHAARRRAIETPAAKTKPYDVEAWCSLIPGEERLYYPIDQSDGGEDDDPTEHAEWAAKLKAMGRNPGTPWKTQNKLITIDSNNDFISDRGDEVWNILEARGIKNVILTGVHLNMCVLGRPFGLRQMARNGKNVVLMRDMTDTMYNPKRWPYVSHLKANDLVVEHIERLVCPTISSDQFIGGKEFHLTAVGSTHDTNKVPYKPYESHWGVIGVPGERFAANTNVFSSYKGRGWYRCVIRIPEKLKADSHVNVSFPDITDGKYSRVGWLDGNPLMEAKATFVYGPAKLINDGEAHLLVIRVENKDASFTKAPILSWTNQTGVQRELELSGRWQFRVDNGTDFSNIPLPAKFGASANIVFTPEEPPYVVRPLTQPGGFTAGIEGPACDKHGNLFVVNFEKQGTIGRVDTRYGSAEVFVELPEGSIGNGIRFGKDGRFFVADYTKHNILRIDPKTKEIDVYAHNDQMNQPNDLAIMSDGTLFASDPNWKDGTGQLWRIDTDGTTHRLATDMGTTNGIEVSPDGKTLYVNESKQRNVWAFDITSNKSISNKRLLRKFEDHGFDGMRCDAKGQLYITRYGKGTVVVLNPAGDIVKEIQTPAKKISNICFGGRDGRTAFVTDVDYRRILQFRVETPGRGWRVE